MLERRCVNMCCIQEVRWRGGSARFLTGKEHSGDFHVCHRCHSNVGKIIIDTVYRVCVSNYFRKGGNGF
ncbi:Hypothetical predicted protein [Octopus vulgaris]|uniref:Uncharacterized protein n=1 Tax=Octopus vulgaris TaxID=6645 RepID=A0AA36FM07_OCTVU|nr:Hypothetical predicted protein [Octopus vulgaris]